MRFNKNQKKGLATVFDNIGTATILAMIVGVFVESKVTIMTASMLFVFSLTCIVIATLLRGGKA